MKRKSVAELRGMTAARLRAHAIQYQATVRGKGFRLQTSARRELAANRSLISADPAAEIQSDAEYLDLIRQVVEEKSGATRSEG